MVCDAHLLPPLQTSKRPNTRLMWLLVRPGFGSSIRLNPQLTSGLPFILGWFAVSTSTSCFHFILSPHLRLFHFYLFISPAFSSPSPPSATPATAFLLIIVFVS